MLWKKIQIAKEDILTGVLYALEYMMEILFFYGTGVVMYGFWQGITGGYLTLFAGMVISGTVVFRILLEIFLKDRKKTEGAVLTAGITEGILFTLFAFRMNMKAGVLILAGCALILILQIFLPEKGKRMVLIICRYSFSLLAGYLALSLFEKGTVTFADDVALLGGILFFDREYFRIPLIMDDKEKSIQKEILPVICVTARKGMFLAALFSIAPVFYQILSQTKGIHMITEYRPVLLLTLISLVFALIESCRRNRHSLLIQGSSLGMIVIIGSVFLMYDSVLTGMISLLCMIALTAFLFLEHSIGHDSPFTWNLTGYIGSHLAMVLILILVFQIYDGIYVDYMTVLKAYFMSVSCIVLWDEMKREIV